MKKIIAAALSVLFLATGYSQFDEHHHCKGEELTKKHYQELGVWEEFQQKYQESTVASQGYQNLSKSVGSIPVIFHVVYNDASDSVTYAQVQAVFADLVSDFSSAGTARGGFGFNPFNPDIDFCLATREPDGTPLLYPGMTVAQTSMTWFDSDNGQENMMKTAANGSQIWNRDQYLNVWICDISNGAGSGTAGYAYRPTGTAGSPPIFLPGANIDGIVLDYNLGLTPNVLTHEVGHYLGLDHPWGGSGGCGNDDGFGDTPFTDGPSFDHPESCSGNQVQCGVQTQYENFMDYANCTSMFSQDQSNHMNYVMDNARSSLYSSNGCAPSNAPPIAAFTADLGGNPIIIPVGGSINFIDQSLNVDAASNPTWAWDFNGGSPNQNVQNPVATYNTVGLYDVTMTVTNDYGNDVAVKLGHVQVVPPAAGTACDTLRNYDLSELPDMLYYGIGGGGGYFPGHSNFFGDNMTIWAEPFTAPATTEARRLELFIMGLADNSGTGSMTMRVYGDDGVNGHPDEGTVLDTEVIPFANLQTGWNEIDLLTPATVTGQFWVGFELNYGGLGDTIIFGLFADPRATGFNNTLKFKVPGAGIGTNDWATGDDIFGPTNNFSLALDVLTSNGPDPTAVISMPENQVCQDAVILANGSGSLNTTDYFWFNTDDPITTVYAQGTGGNFGVNFPFPGDELYILFADGSCRTSVAQESIHIDTPVEAQASTTNTTCGQNNGVINVINEAGGTGVYEYSLDGVNWVTTNTFSNMAPGTYDIYVRTPGQNCDTIFQATVGADPVFTPTISSNQEICTGESIDITAGGGVTYTWLDGNTNIGGTPTINVSPASTTQYSCNVVDGSGCQVTVYTTVVVKLYEDPGFTAVDFCDGAANNATITGVTGGTFAFNPAPGDGATINATTGEISNEVGGNSYTIEYTTPGVGLFCENTSTVNVTVNAQEDASFSTTDFCDGAANNATITGTTGGTFAFNPVPGGGETVNTATGEITGGIAGTTYTLEYTTAGTCNDVQTQTVAVIAADDASFTTTDYCEGAANNATIAGTAGGTFAFNPVPGGGVTVNTTTGEITNGVGGTTYTLEYTTPAGACQATSTETVTVNAQEDASFTTTNFCSGAANNATITGTAGGAFAFNPVPGGGETINATTGEITGGIAGTTYTLEYTTAGTCNDVQTQTVDVIPDDDASFTTADFCVGAANNATITGTAGGTFAFNPVPGGGETVNPATGEITGGIAGTTYTLEYTTPAGTCQATNTETVTVNNLDDASFTTTDYCSGAANNATITGTAGGTFVFNPVPGGGETVNTATGEITGGIAGTTYTLEYTTPAGLCQNNSTQNVSVIVNEDASFTLTDYCAGSANSATAIATAGGTFSFAPDLGDGSTINAGTGEITNGVLGTTYTVDYTTPGIGCQNNTTQTVTVLNSDDPSFTTTDFCLNGTNAATITGTAGGTFSFSVAPGDGATINATTGEIMNETAGTTYSVNYSTPAGACQANSVETVTVLSLDDASFTTTDYCEGTANNATITGTAGGTFAFSVVPGSGEGINPATGEITSGVAGTTYTLEYTTPAGGCQNISTQTVTVIASDDASFTLTDYCAGTANSATGIATGGGNFVFNPAPGDGATLNAATGEITSGIGGTTYSVEYTTPAGGCQNSLVQTVTVNNADDASFTLTDFCQMDANSATAIITPGGTFTFTTPPGDGAAINAATGEISNGVAGTTYDVTYTTPAAGCQNSNNETVTVNTLDDATFVLNNFCEGIANTATGIVTPGGVFSFATAPVDGATIDPSTGEISNETSGTTYDVMYTTPAGGCQNNNTLSVTVNNTPSITGVATNVQCFGDVNGQIDVTIANATPTSISWTNTAQTTEDITGLTAGSYEITVDAGGCVSAETFTIIEPDQIVVDSINVTDIICFGGNGSATLYASGGTGALTADWGGANPNSLGAGTYNVTITDANNCSVVDNVVITEPAFLDVTGVVTEETVGNDGAIDVTVTGGVPPYTFSWSNGEMTEDISNLAPGQYTITVTDDKGCTHFIQFDVTTTIGIEEALLENASIYPNPFNDVINIGLDGDFDYEVKDARGRTIQVGAGFNNKEINLSQHEMGVYFLRLTKASFTKVVKIIKR